MEFIWLSKVMDAAGVDRCAPDAVMAAAVAKSTDARRLDWQLKSANRPMRAGQTV
jgi:hypothetical protein